jgi:ribosomal protein S18 acetylase RimI-like enzyme
VPDQGVECHVSDRDAVIVRVARPGELADVGKLRVTAYRSGGFLSPESEYEPTLRTLGANGNGTVLVAMSPADHSQILGTVMLLPFPHSRVSGQDEAEIRALAVAPEGQGRGTGSELLSAVILLAGQRGIRHLVLMTQSDMLTAHHLYQRAGFRRLPERDWSPVPGISLLAYGLILAPSGAQEAPAFG